jgi:soluble cytochrome b562
MTQEQDDTDDFIEGFREHLSQIDDVAQIVLNGHLEIEAGLDDFLNIVF